VVKHEQDVLVVQVALVAAVVVLSLELLWHWMCLQNHLSSYGTVFHALSIHAI